MSGYVRRLQEGGAGRKRRGRRKERGRKEKRRDGECARMRACARACVRVRMRACPYRLPGSSGSLTSSSCSFWQAQTGGQRAKPVHLFKPPGACSKFSTVFRSSLVFEYHKHFAYNLMGPPSYMRSVIDQNVLMWPMTVFATVGLKFQNPCWLSAGFSSQQLDATCIPCHVTPPSSGQQ